MKKKLIPLAAAIILTGCATNTPMIKDQITDTSAMAEGLYNHVTDTGLSINDGFQISVDDGIWVDTSTVKSSSILPDIIARENYTFIRQDPLTLDELASFISLQTGVRVSRAHELIDQEQGISVDTGSGGYNSHFPTNEQDANTSNSRNYIATGSYVPNMRNTTLKDFLDHVSATLGISWKYTEREGILFYYYDSKTFHVHSTSSDTKLTSLSKNSSSSSGGDSNSGGDASQTIEVTIEPDFWSELSDALTEILTEEGTLVINQATGAVTVNDNEQVLNKVQSYIHDLNRMLKLQVHMRLTILTVRVDASDAAGLSYDLIYNGVDGALGLTTPRLGGSGFGGITGEATGGRWDGSSFFLDALSERGDVSNVITSDLLISNYKPYHYRNGGTLRYIGNITTTNTPDVGTSESVDISELFTGTGLVFMPNIYDKERLTIDLMVSQQDLSKFDQIVLSEKIIKLPETTNQDLVNTFHMRSGESRVLATFEIKRNETKDTGTVAPGNLLLGGSRTASGTRDLMMIIGTPRIL